MKFMYSSYLEMIKLIKEKKYYITNYLDYKEFDRTVILRHDIDMDLEKAIKIAKLENNLGVKSTFFILLSSNFYNIYSKKSIRAIEQILILGHDIGLHFDEERYVKKQCLVEYMEKEIRILENCLGIQIKCISMHRPSKETLMANYEICEGSVINSYSKVFFEDFKYISDSRMYWREDVMGILEKAQYDRIHILTHPFWYGEEEKSMKECLKEFVKSGIEERYNNLNENFRAFEDVLGKDEIIS